MITYIRRHLAWKIFLSYLIVILVGVLVLATAAEFTAPSSFERHMMAMSSTMGMGMMRGAEFAADLDADLFNTFQAAVTEALGLATLAAFTAATLVSVLVSRRVVAPVRQMMVASQSIADGHYSERVEVPGNVSRGELDELAQLAVSFNQMATKLEQTESMRRQLIGDVAHELRTPLATIKGSMEGLMDGVISADAASFQRIHHEADRLQKLVYDLQELSQVEAGAVELERKPLDVHGLVTATIDRLRLQFVEKGVALESDLPPKLPRFEGDEDRLIQVLLNLLGNALQYTPSGGKVTVSARVHGDNVLISVTDTGIGIPPEHLPHIFSRFYRVDKSRSRAGGGSGIGLTIAKHLVEAHGGRIRAESAGSGQGSTFTITLPVSKPGGGL